MSVDLGNGLLRLRSSFDARIPHGGERSRSNQASRLK
jgi:hypothetical protein